MKIKKLIIPSVEVLALVAAIVLVVFEILIPTGPYGSFATLCGFVFVVTELIRRYKEQLLSDTASASHASLDINSKNTFIARWSAKGEKTTGIFCLAFYHMQIVNSSDIPFTVKDVFLEFTLGGKKVSNISNVCPTTTIFSLYEKKDVDTLIVRDGIDFMFLMNWNNLRTEIGKLNVIAPAGVLSGSALFFLNTDKLNELSEVDDFRLVVTDYSGNKSVHDITIQEEWLAKANSTIIEKEQTGPDQ